MDGVFYKKRQPMRRILTTLIAIVLTTMYAMAQNISADDIVGTWSGTQNGDNYRVKVTKQGDGTYQAQMVWLENDKDSDGKKRLDSKNPDKKLRNVPCDRIVIFSGLKYNTDKRHWDGTKIYDPQRGMKAQLTVSKEKDGRMRVKGSLLGISESVYWTRVK